MTTYAEQIEAALNGGKAADTTPPPTMHDSAALYEAAVFIEETIIAHVRRRVNEIRVSIGNTSFVRDYSGVPCGGPGKFVCQDGMIPLVKSD